jgi:hypothetical protein
VVTTAGAGDAAAPPAPVLASLAYVGDSRGSSIATVAKLRLI